MTPEERSDQVARELLAQLNKTARQSPRAAWSDEAAVEAEGSILDYAVVRFGLWIVVAAATVAMLGGREAIAVALHI